MKLRPEGKTHKARDERNVRQGSHDINGSAMLFKENLKVSKPFERPLNQAGGLYIVKTKRFQGGNIGCKATSYAVRKCYQRTAFLIWDQKSASYCLCYQKRPFLIRHFLIKFSDSPILLENPDFLTGWGYQKMLLEKDFNSYRMTVSQP